MKKSSIHLMNCTYVKKLNNVFINIITPVVWVFRYRTAEIISLKQTQLSTQTMILK